MGLYVAPLFVDDAAQLAFHCFESVVDDFVQRLVGAVVHLLFIGDELMAAGNGHIDAATIGISFLVGVIGLLDRDVATVDVVAEFLEPGRVIQNEIVDLVCFFEATISDFNRQLHGDSRLAQEVVLRKRNIFFKLAEASENG